MKNKPQPFIHKMASVTICRDDSGTLVGALHEAIVAVRQVGEANVHDLALKHDALGYRIAMTVWNPQEDTADVEL